MTSHICIIALVHIYIYILKSFLSVFIFSFLRGKTVWKFSHLISQFVATLESLRAFCTSVLTGLWSVQQIDYIWFLTANQNEVQLKIMNCVIENMLTKWCLKARMGDSQVPEMRLDAPGMKRCWIFVTHFITELPQSLRFLYI